MWRGRLASGFFLLLGLAVLGGTAAGACTAGSGNGQGGSGGTSPSSGTSQGGSMSTSSTGEPSGVLFDGGGKSDATVDDDAGCVGQPFKGEQLPLDIFVMLDQSGSMNTQLPNGKTRWEAVTGALATFVQQPNLKGVSLGIQYFGQQDMFGNDSCNAADYAGADVEIAPLPGVAPQIITSIANHYPLTQTPTAPALDGAIQHCTAWANQSPGHVVVNVFATDGEPSECDTNLNNIAAIAAAGANGSPKVLTFVIGVGVSVQNLNQIAAAGGTGQAFLVTDQNANQQFLDALNKIRGSALGCQYTIPLPDGGVADFDQVNVKYTPAGGVAQFVPKVSGKAQCPTDGTDAWYYDDNLNPTLIILCDPTCGKVSNAQQGSQVDVVVGCKTILQ